MDERNIILIVDDEPLNLKILNHILSPEYTIFTASDGPAAIEMAEEFQPNLILLDIIMPGMDGFEVLAALKASDKTRKIPVIFVTGLAQGADKTLDAADYIGKPFSASTVKSKVKSHILKT
jgi:putative two-component system response regulator